MQSAVAMSFAQMCGCGMKQTLGKQQNIIFPILQSHHDEILTAVLVTVICTMHMSLSVNSC